MNYLGTLANIGDWGHEYIRQLENEIVEEWVLGVGSSKELLPLVLDVIKFDCDHHAEIQACDLLMEIDKLEILSKYVDKSIYQRVCLYLMSCSKYVDEVETEKIMKFVADQYLKHGEFVKALVVFIQMRNCEMIEKVFSVCKDE